jgi:hypothetical protein
VYWSARCGSVLLVLSFTAPSAVYAANVLDGAVVQIRFTAPAICEVSQTLTVSLDSAAVVDHRVQSFQGTAVELTDLSGASGEGPPVPAGTTQSLRVRLAAGTHEYTIKYRVRQPEAWSFRCPTWLPAIPADGVSRNVHVAVDLPDNAAPTSNAFPAMDWQGNRGSVQLGHVPSFVRAPYNAPGLTAPDTVDVRRTMDVTAIGLLIAGTGLWAWRRRS